MSAAVYYKIPDTIQVGTLPSMGTPVEVVRMDGAGNIVYRDIAWRVGLSWFSHDNSQGDPLTGDKQPTHWRPLPTEIKEDRTDAKQEAKEGQWGAV